MPINLDYQKFVNQQLSQNPHLKMWEINDMWLDHQHSVENEDEDDEQMTSIDQTTYPLVSVKNYREDEEVQQNEEDQDPNAAAITAQLQKIGSSPNLNTLGLKLDCVGKKDPQGNDSRVWYVFSNKTENTPTGVQAKKWGGFGTTELKKMGQQLQDIGDKGLSSHFNGLSDSQIKR